LSQFRPQERTTDLGTAPLGALLVRLSMPGIVGMLVMSLYNVVDTFWVSGLPEGKEAIAALTVMFPLQLIAGAFGVGTGIGVASLVARRFGEGRLDEVNDVGGNAVTLPLVVGILLTGTCLTFPEQMLYLFGAQADIMGLAMTYLTTVLLGMPFLLFSMTVAGLYRGSGNAVMPMITMGASAGVNLVLDPFLIYGWGPFPHLGVQGAALATVIAQVCSFALSAGYLASSMSGYRIAPRHLMPRLRILRDIAQVGAPAFATQFTNSLIATVFNRVLGSYGSVAIAAYGLTFRVMMLIFPLMMGVTQGLLPIVGYSFGAKQYRRLWGAFRTATAWTSGLALALSAALWIGSPAAVGLFARDPELSRLTVLSLRIHLLTLCLVQPTVMAVATLQGMGMGPQAMLLTLTRDVIFVVPGLLLLSAQFGIAGAFAARPVADVLALAVTAFYLSSVYARYHGRAEEPALAQPCEATVPDVEAGGGD